MKRTQSSGLPQCGALTDRRRGRAKVEYCIFLSFLAVIFVTGGSWVMPLLDAISPALADWLQSFRPASSLVLCGFIALLLVAAAAALLNAATRVVARWRRKK